MFRIPFDRVNWITSSFLIGTALIALIGAPIYLYHFGINWFQFGMFFFYLCATMMSITVGYHRLFSHLSFKAKTPVKIFTLIFGACAFENSALNWCSDHRRHHKHVDHDEDPYDISKGFFWAHIGWLLFKLNPEPPVDNVADLRKDKLVMWQHRYTHWIGLVVGLIAPAALGYGYNTLMGLDPMVGALGGFLIAGVTRIVIAQHCTFFINSLCHTVGKQPYSTKHSARDSAIMAFLTFGEGYHNYHHEFQHDYRNGVKAMAVGSLEMDDLDALEARPRRRPAPRAGQQDPPGGNGRGEAPRRGTHRPNRSHTRLLRTLCGNAAPAFRKTRGELPRTRASRSGPSPTLPRRPPNLAGRNPRPHARDVSTRETRHRLNRTGETF